MALSALFVFSSARPALENNQGYASKGCFHLARMKVYRWRIDKNRRPVSHQASTFRSVLQGVQRSMIHSWRLESAQPHKPNTQAKKTTGSAH